MRQPFTLERTTLPSGIELDYVDEGPRDAPAMLFLHGFPESHWTWRNQIPHFSDRYRVIVPDQRGYAKSSKPEGVENYTADKLAQDIFALAEALGIERFTLVGHDWGGALAWLIALMSGPTGPATYRGKVARLIIANAPHPYIFQKLLFDNPEQRAASQYIRGFRDSANDDLIRDTGIAGILMKEFGGAEGSAALTDQDRQIYFRDWNEPGAAFAMLNWYRASNVIVPAMDETPERPASVDGPFPSTAMPTLVIWALDDVALPPCNLDGLGDMVPDLKVVKIPGAGHFVPWEKPDAVNAVMDEWLSTH